VFGHPNTRTTRIGPLRRPRHRQGDQHAERAVARDSDSTSSVRVGIHRGLVYLDTAQDDVYGLGANFAARVCSIAAPGTVAASSPSNGWCATRSNSWRTRRRRSGRGRPDPHLSHHRRNDIVTTARRIASSAVSATPVTICNEVGPRPRRAPCRRRESHSRRGRHRQTRLAMPPTRPAGQRRSTRYLQLPFHTGWAPRPVRRAERRCGIKRLRSAVGSASWKRR
jgi:hypothetical protein